MAALPVPYPGLVIRYAYLWSHKDAVGLVEGVKDRPCGVVIAIRREGTRSRVLVAPVMHAPPGIPEDAAKLPESTRHRLGLDSEANWVIASETNEFDWQGPDIRRTPAGEYRYRELPAGLLNALKIKILSYAKLPRIVRTE